MKGSAKVIVITAGLFFFFSFGLNVFLLNETVAQAHAQQFSSQVVSRLIIVRDVLRIVSSHFVDADEVKQDDLIYGAIRGILQALKDPYTRFMPPKQSQDMKVETSGKFGGLGIIIGERKKRITVIAPLSGTPAHKAGMQSGDVFVRIDGKSIEGQSLQDVVDKLRGAPDTSVKVTIWREGNPDLIDFKIVRAIIKLPSVKSRLLDDRIGYAYVSNFSQTTAEDLDKALSAFRSKGMKSFILDLRHNPGGVLEAAVDVGRLFLPQAPIVSVKSRSGERITYSSFSRKYENFPLIVLIDGGSASASEIVAGAIKDNRRGILLGTKSFGKGCVQTVLNMRDRSAIALTTAYYYTPSGVCIHKVGIHPDIEVQLQRMTQKELIELREARAIFMEDESSDLAAEADSEDRPKLSPEEAQEIVLRHDKQLKSAVDILRGARIFSEKALELQK